MPADAAFTLIVESPERTVVPLVPVGTPAPLKLTNAPVTFGPFAGPFFTMNCTGAAVPVVTPVGIAETLNVNVGNP